MNYVEFFDLFGVEAKQIPCDRDPGAPTESTVGAVGCLYMDTDTGEVYKCIAVEDDVYTWEVFGGGLDTTASNLLITILRNAVYNTDQSANITTLAEALTSSGDSGGEDGSDEPSIPDESEKTLSSISATYNGGDVIIGTAISSLTGIVVTAHYSDGTSETVTGYTLSGTIAEGNNTITVSYSGKTATFTVTGVAEETGDTGEAVAMTLNNSPSTGVKLFSDAGETPKLAYDCKGYIVSNDVFTEDTKVKVKLKFNGIYNVYDRFYVASYDEDLSTNGTGFYGITLGTGEYKQYEFINECEYIVRAGHKLIVSAKIATFEEYSVVSLGACKTQDKEYEEMTAPVKMTKSKVSWYSDDGATVFSDSFTGRDGYHTVSKVFDTDTNVRITINTWIQAHTSFYVSNTQWNGTDTSSAITLNYATDMTETDEWKTDTIHTIDYQVKAGNRLCVSAAMGFSDNKVFVEVI